MDQKSVQVVAMELARPFGPDEIQWRIGSRTKDKKKGLALAYIDVRAVMKRLDEVVGMQNWQDEYEIVKYERSVYDRNAKADKLHMGVAVVCKLGLRVENEWIWKSDMADMTDVEAAKGGCSDALKRAFVKFGGGRQLYELDSPWVELTSNGYAIAPNEFPRLNRIIEQAAKATPARKKQPEKPSVRDELSAHNQQVLSDFGYSEQEIQEMSPQERYRPLKFAMDQLGYQTMAEIQELEPDLIQPIKDAMEAWKHAEEPLGDRSESA